MSFRTLAPLGIVAVLVGLVGVGCSKSDVSMQNDLRGAPPVVARGGGADDGIKPGPKPVTPVVGRGGKNDDGIKPAPAPMPVPARLGTNDDGVRPAAPQKAPPPKP